MIQIAHQAIEFLGQNPIPIPDPPAKPLPGPLGERVNDIIGYAKTIFAALAVLGLLAVAGLTVVGIKGRSEVAKSALGHLPWAIAALAIGGGAAGLIEAFS